jgi:predicted porin
VKSKYIIAASLALAGSLAHAQTNVQIYGLIDSALVVESGGPKGSTTKIESGVSNGSRLGFKGTEDLGGGLSAIFLLESGILVDTGASDQNGLLFGRQAYVGLRQKGLGTLTMGRQYTPIYQTLTMIDPSANNYGGAAGQLMSGEKAGVRQNNMVMVTSDTMSGVTGQLAYSAGEVAGNNAASRSFGGSLTYLQGGLTARIGYNQTNNATATDSARNTLAIAKYDFGFLTAGIGYGINKGMGTIDTRDTILALTVPFGRHTVMATFIDKDDRAPAHKFGAQQYAGTYLYSLSKRTSLYAAYAHLSNTRFTTTKFGTGNREFDLGIKHIF